MVPSRTTYPSYEHISYQDGGNPVVVVTNNRFTVPVSVNNEQTLVKIPNWRDRIAMKQNASGAYTRRLTEIEPGWARCEVITKSASFTGGKRVAKYLSNRQESIPTSYIFDDPTVSDIALTRLKRKLQSHSASMNLITPVAELKELRSTIKATADLTEHFAYVAYQIVKKHENKRPRAMIKNLSKAWLTYSFGMNPLVSEVRKIADSIVQFLLQENHNVVLTGTASKRWISGERGINNRPAPYGATRANDSSLIHNLSYQWKGGFHVPVDATKDYGALEHFKIAVPSFVPTAWELVPFSWLVDYFATVGPWLDDTFTGTPGTAVYLTRTRRYEVKGTDTMRFERTTTALPTTSELYWLSKPTKWRHLDFSRTIHTSLPMSALRLRTTDEMGIHGIHKLLNLLSVLGSSR